MWMEERMGAFKPLAKAARGSTVPLRSVARSHAGAVAAQGRSDECHSPPCISCTPQIFAGIDHGQGSMYWVLRGLLQRMYGLSPAKLDQVFAGSTPRDLRLL
jgi:hypothetical protein